MFIILFLKPFPLCLAVRVHPRGFHHGPLGQETLQMKDAVPGDIAVTGAVLLPSTCPPSLRSLLGLEQGAQVWVWDPRLSSRLGPRSPCLGPGLGQPLLPAASMGQPDGRGRVRQLSEPAESLP